MRTCVYCESPLPESTYKGHRRREYCNDACKNKNYREYKKTKHDIDKVAEPYWKEAYQLLVVKYKWLEDRLQERIKDASKSQDRIDDLEWLVNYYAKQHDNILIECEAKLKALGVSEEDIKEFDAYWKVQMDSRSDLGTPDENR